MASLARELEEMKRKLGAASDEATRLSDKLLNSEAVQQILEEDLRGMEKSFNETVQRHAEDTLYGIWFHYPDLDYSRVDPSYEEKASEWRAEKAAAQEALGGGASGSNVPALSEQMAGIDLHPLFTPPVVMDEMPPPPPPPPIDEPIPPPPPTDDPVPAPLAELDSTLPEPPADPIPIVDLSPVSEEQQEPGQCQGQDSGQGA